MSRLLNRIRLWGSTLFWLPMIMFFSVKFRLWCWWHHVDYAEACRIVGERMRKELERIERERQKRLKEKDN